jgi:type I restriction enzyme S subunit
MVRFRSETDFKKTLFGEIPKDWDEKKIGEIADVGGGTTPSTKVKDYWDGDVTWITPNDLASHRFRYIARGERNITEKAVRENSLRIYPSETVLLTSRAPIGYIAIARNPVTTNQGFKNIIPKDGTKSEFLYYFLKNIVEYLRDIAGGSTFSELTATTLREVKIPYPSSTEQSRISTILSWFDSLIENKKKQNDILQKTAMAVFRSWFINFEPFSDNEFVDSALGKIPKGWDVKEVGKAVEFLYGKGLPENKREAGPFPVVGSSGIVGHHSKNLVSSSSIVVGRKGNAGSVYLMLEPSFPIDTVFYSSDDTPSELIFYIYHFLQEASLEDVGLSDTAVPGLNIHVLNSVKVLLPPQPILEKFRYVVEPLLKKMFLNQKQILVLAEVRDVLLPLLVLGKLRVEEI